MLRSKATSPLVRRSGYALSAMSALLFGCVFVTSIRIAFRVDPLGVRTWIFGAALLCLATVVLVGWYVVRRPYSGGHFLAALACVAASFALVVSWIPLLALQS